VALKTPAQRAPGSAVTVSAQNYLKAIYVLEVEFGPVSTNDLADRLGVAAPSVTSMMKRLASDGLVAHLPYHGVRLTPKGRTAALRVVRRHRLIEAFLHDVLDVPWDEVHDEAEVLEHAISDRLEDRIAETLGHPQRDCHGDPIPPKRGRHRELVDEPLDQVVSGTRVRVERVSDRDPAALRYFARRGIGLGTELIVDRSDLGGATWVRVGNRRHPLEPALARAISVSIIDRDPDAEEHAGD
jgi:DtxR family Mn-dependent transcriptional regulator